MVRPVGGGPPPEIPKTVNATVPYQLPQWIQTIGQAISLVKKGDYESLGDASYLLGQVQGQMLAYGYSPDNDPLGSLMQATDIINSNYGGKSPDTNKICNLLLNAMNILNQLKPVKPIK